MNQEQKMAEFKALMQRGIDGIRAAGKQYADLVRDQPGIATEIRRQMPSLTQADLEWFARVGCGEMDDKEILERGVRIVQAMQGIQFN